MEKLVVGPINKGLKTYREPFVIDNDSFPVLQNAYQWRGRVKRKRGTAYLCQLQRFFNPNLATYSPTTNNPFDGGGNLNLLVGYNLTTLSPNATIVPGSVQITDRISGEVYTDPAQNGTLIGSLGDTGTINYATGAVLAVNSAGHNARSIFSYYPQLPVMGLEDLRLNPNVVTTTLAFDTTYSYLLTNSIPSTSHDVSFYKNPFADPVALPGYVPKNIAGPNFPTATTWNGQDYQQFWTTNYQGALWATNGVTVPFTGAGVGMQFAPSGTITFVSQTATTLVVTITNCPLVIGDFVFVNEFVGSTPANSATLNYQSGYVTACAPNTTPLATKTLTITFPNAAIAIDTYAPGMIQYLTNRSNPAVDCIRWFDGDPTNGVASTPVLDTPNGWVNFMPPLSQAIYSVADLPLRQYYLVGAKMIVAYKDRLLFFGPVVQTSDANAIPVYLQDTVVYSQNGTPYYTASFGAVPNSAPPVVDPVNVSTVFFPILVPVNQTATAPAWFEDQIGFGGYVSAGVSDTITTVSPNEDALIVGFTQLQTKLIATGNDVDAFEFFIINSELGSGSTFSFINMDEGIISRGSRGYVMTSQVQAIRIDVEIPDEVFEIALLNNGSERFTAQRDFINEWIYFTFPSNQIKSNFYPNNTLLYNYRDQSYAIFQESYTTYGQFRTSSNLTWATLPYTAWTGWTDPWNAGVTTAGQVEVIAGNTQGFVILRSIGTSEEASLMIQSFTGSTVTSPNHCLNEGDYIIIEGAIGTIGPLVNGQVFQVQSISSTTFALNPAIGTGTYFGGGYITRMYIPFIQTKQFPLAWSIGRKTRIGPQMYLFDTTAAGQVTVEIYLSQDAANAFNSGPIAPLPNCVNNSLIYSQIVYTCPESTNMGLTPANINLNMVPSVTQAQTWHRMNTSLIGDTIQLGFTLNDSQMRSPSQQFAEITLHGFVIDVEASMLLA